jgi:hypothetical protein
MQVRQGDSLMQGEPKNLKLTGVAPHGFPFGDLFFAPQILACPMAVFGWTGLGDFFDRGRIFRLPDAFRARIFIGHLLDTPTPDTLNPLRHKLFKLLARPTGLEPVFPP